MCPVEVQPVEVQPVYPVEVYLQSIWFCKIIMQHIVHSGDRSLQSAFYEQRPAACSLAPPAAQILQMESTFVISCLSAVNGILKYSQWNPRTFILWWSVFSWCRGRCEFNRVHLRRLFANIAIDQYPGIPIIKDFGHDDDDQNQLRCGWWWLRNTMGGFALAD